MGSTWPHRPVVATIDLRPVLVDRIRTRLAALQRSVDDLLLHQHSSSERLHRLHAELRHARVELRIWRRTVPPSSRRENRLRELRLAQLARRVGEVRDTDLRMELLERVAARADAAQRRSDIDLLRSLGEEARIGRELLVAHFRAEREAGLFRELVGTLDPPHGRSRRPVLPAFLDEEVGRARARARAALRRARRKISVRRAHRLRIQLRRARSLLQLISGIAGAAPSPYPERLVHLQRSLGKLHDLDVLEDWVHDLSPRLRRVVWARDLRRRRRDERHRLREWLRERSVRGALHTLGRDPEATSPAPPP